MNAQQSIYQQLMPLRLLATSMRRMQAASASDTHPLHALLDELLLTVPSMKAKYRTELQRILINGGGAGDVEEAMMWYAITHEHADIQEPWLDVPWREQYLERLERREYVRSAILSTSLTSAQGSNSDHSVSFEAVPTGTSKVERQAETRIVT